MILIKIDKQSTVPVFRQIIHQLAFLIDGGVLKVGDRLPASRMLAAQLGVNRATVYRAYEELWAAGYTESRPGSYSVVRARMTMNVDLGPPGSLIDWAGIGRESRLVGQSLTFAGRKLFQGEIINFRPLSPDSRLMPVDDFRKCMHDVLAKEGASLLQYGDMFGYRPLREFLVRHLQKHGIQVSVDEIMLTNGSQQSLDLILRFFDKPGLKVAVEQPSYSQFINLLDFYQAQVVGLPMGENGADLAEVDRIFVREKPAFFYTMPNFHNPLGISTSQEYRERLLKLCETHRVVLIEDGFEEEMKFFGKAILPIKSMDSKQVVIYLGTFSKVLFPGLRVGWIAADKACISHLAAIRQIVDHSGNQLSQAAIYKYCISGYYDLHLKRLHREYRKRMQAALKAVREFIPEIIRCTKPSGGYLLWMKMPDDRIEESVLLEKLSGAGVSVSPGQLFFSEKQTIPAFRLSIAHLDETEIRLGMERIGRVLSEVYGR
jgi:GntR family transcriptional regulator/MocR family aminotransferase